ncbi:MAG: Ig-like domain-containing protein, partial [Muribaculaceae bacterium]|nr:Ig-like domain-containing protein [Muribaculaceae bacterium]
RPAIKRDYCELICFVVDVETGEVMNCDKYPMSEVAEHRYTVADLVRGKNLSVDSITLDKSEAYLIVGEQISFKATVLPENATNKSVTWTSSNTSVATVDANGKVTAVAVGEATITATTTDGSNLSASCTVTVVLTQDDDNTIFDENFDDWSSAFAQILLYEGDHNAPAAEMTVFEFDADNTPWNFSLRDSDATTDYAAASHSIYANKGKSDDWMSTPQLYIPDDKCVFTFDAQTLDNTGDKLKVVIWENKEVINTLTDRVMEDYRANAKVIMDKELKSGGSQTLAGEWEHFAFDLAEYAGKEIYIGFVNENENKGMVFVDNVSVKRNAEFVISLETETTVVRQDNIEIKGRIRVDNETETYSTASFTLKDAEGKTLEVISEDGLALKQGDIYSFKFANRLPLEYGKTVKYTVDVALGEHKNSVRGTIKNLSFTPTKRVVVEKMTGNTCVNCPKGIIAFDLLHDTYGELFIPVAIHTYTGDPFGSGLSAYSSFLGLVGAPSGVVNRSGVVTYPMDQDENGAWRYSNPNDPLWWDAVAAEFKVLSEADINVKSAVYNTESKTIDIPVMTKFAVDAEGLNLNLFAVILENRLDGAYQVNNLSGYTDPILGEWGQGGEYGKSAVPYTYDHVARGIYGTTWNGTGGLIPSNVVSGEVYENTLSLAIPETIRDIKNCEAVVMLIDANNGKVLNAAVGKLYDATGVVTQSIELDREKVDLAIGTTVQLTAAVLPETTANKTVSWTSSNTSVAVVDENGVVTAISVGEAIITATTTDGSNLSASCKVTVHANYLSGKTINTYSGASERVSVEMTNEQAITAFQCDIYLPDGISIATIDGEYDINLSSRAKSSHSLSCVEQSDGSIRLLCYSMSLATFSGNEGELFDINFDISKEIEGEYQVLIGNIVLTDKVQNEYKSSTTIDFNVKAYVPADVNNDGSINVTDVVATASYILGLDTKKFIFEAADMNKDGVINVTDIVGIASIILNGGTASNVSSQRCAPNSSDVIKIEDFAADKNQSQQVAIEMTNASDYSACQMDIRLPKGMSIA